MCSITSSEENLIKLLDRNSGTKNVQWNIDKISETLCSKAPNASHRYKYLTVQDILIRKITESYSLEKLVDKQRGTIQN